METIGCQVSVTTLLQIEIKLYQKSKNCRLDREVKKNSQKAKNILILLLRKLSVHFYEFSRIWVHLEGVFVKCHYFSVMHSPLFVLWKLKPYAAALLSKKKKKKNRNECIKISKNEVLSLCLDQTPGTNYFCPVVHITNYASYRIHTTDYLNQASSMWPTIHHNVCDASLCVISIS